ncbi:putative Xanthine dehydrogenase accessory protein (plasmid) [Sinorhizobium fredii HH103]|uniref:Xanthine dehydrogenase accessory protein n=2 Tax=Rhizobium fredii TaxID=380 RepID=G9AJF6_SINF1|nr:putative Xanthine dehydrogenase accessory protein [Sinorhizobium fredii HH103]
MEGNLSGETARGRGNPMLSKLDEELPVPHHAVLTDDPDKILDFARSGLRSGLGCALVTLVEIQGGAARSLGAHMAVREDGLFCGFVSGGCVEAVVAAEAIQAIRAGCDRTLVLGKGSRFFDIVLPCGGSISLVIHVLRRSEPLDAVLAALASRQRAGLRYDARAQSLEFLRAAAEPGWEQGGFITSYRPATRIVLCGRSIELKMTISLAEAVGYDIIAFGGAGAEAVRPEQLDEDSAVAFLHHDLDKEMALLEIAAASRAFYIGALGSERTHRRRCDELRRRGFSDASIARIKAPIGLFPKARDAGSLALSVLADIAARRAAAR